MVREIRNLKGEVVGTAGDKHRDSEEGGGLSVEGLLLICAAVLLLLGIFPGLFGRLLQVFDIRQWAWWLYPVGGLLLFFFVRCVRLFFAARSTNPDREYDPVDARLFARMSVFVSAGMISLLVAHSCTWLDTPIWLLKKWLGKGAFSWEALLYFAILCVFVGISSYLAKAWVFHYSADND